MKNIPLPHPHGIAGKELIVWLWATGNGERGKNIKKVVEKIWSVRKKTVTLRSDFGKKFLIL